MTPLVLVHGFMGGSAQWDGVAAALAGRAEVIAVDLPGFGGNAHLDPINRIEGFADWVIGHLSERGIDRYDLLGHSMGGMVAQEIARRDRKRLARLVLYSTGATGVLPGRFETIAESKRRARADGAQRTARRIAATWYLALEQAAGFEACARIAERASLAAIEAGLDAMEAWSGEAALSDIDMETLVIWGEFDRTYGWEQVHGLWRTIPRAHLAVIPGCAHAVHDEKPDIFARILLDFLETH
ncbi:alpha/beta fold hydrolase [Pseudaestuariivita atlantica]|uniref:Alpha/beta hydrolase n=1 Tax=Pseudaestuariivita atlantica TaxID=1317121 RepID=A0A0L1JLP4_9RHOB|nr:alpha/beta fold hydrolase [Pseudaestuariivita atlantica]KNG92674.1 alpha/beta hydrolase [Pseudaestuariivita atlantica]